LPIRLDPDRAIAVGSQHFLLSVQSPVKEGRLLNLKHPVFVISVSLVLLAGGLRLFRLGAWSFHGDELAMLKETTALRTPHQGPLTEQGDRLPRLIPVSYRLQLLGYELFGQDEWGTRVLPALLGTLQVLLVFLGLQGPLGRLPALATALLMAVWPEHVYRSQENRFYMAPSLFASLCMIAGAHAVQRRSAGWTVAACLAALAALLAHTLQGGLFVGLFAAIATAAWTARDGRLLRLLGIVAGAALLTAVFVACYILPLVRGWNTGETWGYGPLHSVLASVSQLGWPIALLAALGAVSVWKANDVQAGYWGVWMVVWFAASLMLPFVVSYHPAYVFPLTLGPLVLAGRAIGQVYKGLQKQNALAGPVWLGLACLMNFPSLISYYADGARFDFRTATHHVAEHWQEGDRLAGFSPSLLKHYAPSGIEPIALRAANPVADLQKLTREPGRLWIVVPSNRSGKPEQLARWLDQHCARDLNVRKARFDYYENAIEVFVYPPSEGTGQPFADAARR
jgi:hypothetical protein